MVSGIPKHRFSPKFRISKAALLGLVIGTLATLPAQAAANDFLFDIVFPSAFKQTFPLNFHQTFPIDTDSAGTWTDTVLTVDAGAVEVSGSTVTLTGMQWALSAKSWQYEQKPFLKIRCQNPELTLNWAAISIELPNPWQVDLTKADGLNGQALVDSLDRAIRAHFEPEALKRDLSFNGDCQGDAAKVIASIAQAWLGNYPDKQSQQYAGLLASLKAKLAAVDSALLVTKPEFKSLVASYPVWQAQVNADSYTYRPQSSPPTSTILSPRALDQLAAIQRTATAPFLLINSTAMSTLASQAITLWAAKTQAGNAKDGPAKTGLKVGANGVPYFDFPTTVKASDLQFFLDELQAVPPDTSLGIRFVVEDCSKQPRALSALPWVSQTGLDAGFYAVLGLNIQLVLTAPGAATQSATETATETIVAERRLNDFLMSWRLVKTAGATGLSPILESGGFKHLQVGAAQGCAGVKSLPPEIVDSLNWVFTSDDFVSRINNDLLAGFRDFMAAHVKPRFLGSINAGRKLSTGNYEAEALLLEVLP